MGSKIEKNSYPNGSGPNDWQCFGPPATADGDFDNCKIADMGCFTQDGKDSNKYYHAAIVKHKTSGQWAVYFEWGRTGAKNPNFQFVVCTGEADAQREFAGQLHDKNDKRGEWVTVASKRVLRARAGKDCYLVRSMATRSTGLPDARTIKHTDSAPKKKADAAPDDAKADDKKGKKKVIKASGRPVDSHTQSLLRDLNVATVQYTRGSMADDSIPTQGAIDEARDFLTEAQKRLIIVGDDVDAQVADADLNHLTALMYGRIPKKKPLHCPPQDWILNTSNILRWQADLDAFEAALGVAADVEDTTHQHDPFGGMPVWMEWIDPKTDLGKWLYGWWPRATANRHGGVGAMRIKNAWRVERQGDRPKLVVSQEKIIASRPAIHERPLFQPSERADLQDNNDIKRFRDSNTGLLFHGTRSVNVTGILRENLRLPHQLVGVVITGAMFGPGLYWADDWKKSAGYTSLRGSYWSSGGGSVRGREAFMFAGDVALGRPHVAPGPKGYTSPPAGHHCVFGKGGHSQVMNNEWIIFSREQFELRYLVEFAA